MAKKPLIFLILFILLVFINLLVALKLRSYYRRKIYSSKILKEIESQFNFSVAPFSTGSFQAETKMEDGRVANLKAFFRKHNSPLFDWSETVVKYADKYGFDYRLLPAIAMQESNVCKVIPDNSYNCWGWGIYGTTVTRFDSYEEAIETVSRGIKQHYLDKGLITASSIMQKYTPSSNGSWANGVNFFLRDLE